MRAINIRTMCISYHIIYLSASECLMNAMEKQQETNEREEGYEKDI